MATAKKTRPLPTSTTTTQARASVKAVKGGAAPTPLKPIKTAFNRTSLIKHLADQSGVEPKTAKAVLGALELTVLASIHKKGIGEFTLPGLLKVSAQNVPAKKKRFGKDPFSGEERWFAAKPASVKIKSRALKKLKDAAL